MTSNIGSPIIQEYFSSGNLRPQITPKWKSVCAWNCADISGLNF
jgi:hypothetical protein